MSTTPRTRGSHRRGRRALAAVTIVFVLAVVMVASLSDRLPGFLDDSIDNAGRWIEARFSIDLVDRGDVPLEGEQIAHLGIWMTVMIIVGGLVRRWPLADTACALFVLGIVTEILQATTTTSRQFEVDDLSFNALGVLLGLTILLVGRRALALVRR